MSPEDNRAGTSGLFISRIFEVAQVQQYQKKSEEKSDISQTGHDEGLFPGLGGVEFFVPKTDQQIRAQAHQFPEKIELEQGRGEGQGHHGPGEEGVEGIIAGQARVAGHVAQGVDLHQETDPGHHGEHEQAGRIQ